MKILLEIHDFAKRFAADFYYIPKAKRYASCRDLGGIYAMKSACFTGHRNIKGNLAELEERLNDALEKAVHEENITIFYNGGSVGFDHFAAKVVLKLKKKYPQIKLCMVLPCSPEEQSEKWSDKQKREYFDILKSADSVEQTSGHYYTGCMKVRNARLVELVDYCFCYWNPKRKRSGTGQTVRMAQKKNITVVNFYESDMANNSIMRRYYE